MTRREYEEYKIAVLLVMIHHLVAIVCTVIMAVLPIVSLGVIYDLAPKFYRIANPICFMYIVYYFGIILFAEIRYQYKKRRRG